MAGATKLGKGLPHYLPTHSGSLPLPQLRIRNTRQCINRILRCVRSRLRNLVAKAARVQRQTDRFKQSEARVHAKSKSDSPASTLHAAVVEWGSRTLR